MACKVKAELEAAFKKLDANGDGYVTASELQNFMVTLDAYKSLSKDKVKEASAVRSLTFGRVTLSCYDIRNSNNNH